MKKALESLIKTYQKEADKNLEDASYAYKRPDYSLGSEYSGIGNAYKRVVTDLEGLLAKAKR
jgi:hypothetical protein